MREGEATKCRTCGAQIVWVKTERGATMPCDLRHADDGDFFLFLVAERIEAVHVRSHTPRAVRAVSRGDKRYTSHFQTCPRAHPRTGGRSDGNGTSSR